MPIAEMQESPSLTQKDMPYVAFETRPEENRKKSEELGYVFMEDVHYARITPPGSRDVHYEKLPAWWMKLDREARSGRLLPQWIDAWKSNYERFRKGQEIPEDGTPIRGWTMITAAQQENLIACNVKTVEDLATLPSEGMGRIGMGALELRRRAESWLAQRDTNGAGATKLAAALRENEQLKATIASLTEKVDALSKQSDGKAKRA